MYVEDTSSQPTSASNSAGDECEGHISITDKVPLHGSVRTSFVAEFGAVGGISSLQPEELVVAHCYVSLV